jgi:hypothetical protein
MSDAPRRTGQAATEGGTAADPPAAPDLAGPANAAPTEDELDWRENQSRPPREVALTDLFLLALWGLAAAAVIAILVVLYRHVL